MWLLTSFSDWVLVRFQGEKAAAYNAAQKVPQPPPQEEDDDEEDDDEEDDDE